MKGVWIVQIVDRKTIPWFIGTLIAYAVATVAYLMYAHATPRGPHGGSIPGLIYAIVGSALILFALVLNVRKRWFGLRVARLGRAYTWMQAHIWLGTLSYPIIIYHAGFKWGGPLTQVLMWVFTLVILTGILGLVLQQFIPGMLKRDVPRETVIGQIDHVMDRLRIEADALVSTAERAGVELGDGSGLELVGAPAGASAVATAAAPVAVEQARQRLLLRSFYEQQVLPLLDRKTTPRLTHAKWEKFNLRFAGVRAEFPQSLHETMDDLQSIVRERAQLETQRRLQWVLNCWLLVHIPLSYAMVVLAVIHAVWAWKYAPIEPWW